MIKVDWSLAPSDATHAGTKHAEGVVCWYKWSNDSYHYWYMVDSVLDTCGWDESEGRPCHWPLEERPQPKPWPGPEDGLPPVGSNVELCGITTVAREEYDAYEHCVVDTWKNGDTLEVLAHKNIYGKDGVIVFNTRKMQASALMADCYRAIRTTQQLIDSSRSSAIREIMDAAGIDCRVTATRLVDAGFKR